MAKAVPVNPVMDDQPTMPPPLGRQNLPDARGDLLLYAVKHKADIPPDLYGLIRIACATIDMRDVAITKLRGLIIERFSDKEPDKWRTRASTELYREYPVDFIRP